MVRLRERERFRARKEPEESPDDAAESRRIAFRNASPVVEKRIRPRSVSLMVALFIIVLMAILLLG